MCAGFNWDQAWQEIDGFLDGKLNIAHEAVDRHAVGPRRDHVAIRWLGKRGAVRDFTYADLAVSTSRFASALRGLGVGKSDRVFVLANRIPELYVAAFGIYQERERVCPAVLSVWARTDPQAHVDWRGQSADHDRGALPPQDSQDPRHASRPRAHHRDWPSPGANRDSPTHDFGELLAKGSEHFQTEPMDREDMALLHFTSGTTGTPKGAVHVHGAVLYHYLTGKYALDMHPDDVFWCTADPGWVTGTSYGIISPLTHGLTNIVDEGEFDAERWYRTLQEQKVTIWYTAPTAVRMMMKVGADVPREFDLSRLRLIASVGEPLNDQYQLRISIYHHVGDWTESLLHALEVAQKVNHPRVGVNFNLCHWLKVDGDKDYRPVLRENGKRIFAVTINGAECRAQEWTNGLIQPLDRGDFDNRELLNILQQAGYDGPIGLMCYGIVDDTRDHLQRSMRIWKSWQQE